MEGCIKNTELVAVCDIEAEQLKKFTRKYGDAKKHIFTQKNEKLNSIMLKTM